MPQPKEITQQREERAWLLRQKGWTQEKIAGELGVSQMAVCKILQRVGARLAATFREQAEAIKAEQTAKLEYLYVESVEQWERSYEDRQCITRKTGRVHFGEDGSATPLPDEVTFTSEGQSGNPALLNQARGALSDIRTIWGLDAPKKQELSGPAGGEIPLTVRSTVDKIYGDGPSDPEPAGD